MIVATALSGYGFGAPQATPCGGGCSGSMAAAAGPRFAGGFGLFDSGPRHCGIFEDLSSQSQRVEYAAKAYALRCGGAIAPDGLINLVKAKGFCSKVNVDGQVKDYGCTPKPGDAPSVDAAEKLDVPIVPPPAQQQLPQLPMLPGIQTPPTMTGVQQLQQLAPQQQQQQQQGMSRNTIIAIAGAGVLVLGLVAAVVIRRRK